MTDNNIKLWAKFCIQKTNESLCLVIISYTHTCMLFKTKLKMPTYSKVIHSCYRYIWETQNPFITACETEMC